MEFNVKSCALGGPVPVNLRYEIAPAETKLMSVVWRFGGPVPVNLGREIAPVETKLMS